MARNRKSTSSGKRRSGINIKKKNQGKLRKTTGTKKGKKVPKDKLRKLKKSKNPLTRKRATFALNAKEKFGKKK